jgi:lipoate-protein ligase A
MLNARLIQSGFCNAATNMAIDEALFLSYRENISTPILRLYGWMPASLSIGCFQDPEKILNLEACEKENISFVRRPTGGGIIFHDHELTYSLILAQSDIKLCAGVKASFEKITQFLISAYRSLRLETNFAKDILKKIPLKNTRAEFCFSRSEEYDILICGRKIGGNAQKRKKNIILQHGSIPFSFNKQRVQKFIKDPKIFETLNITHLDEQTKSPIDFKNLSKHLIYAFDQNFGLKLQKSDLTTEEKELTVNLFVNKYANPKWSFHKKPLEYSHSYL